MKRILIGMLGSMFFASINAVDLTNIIDGLATDYVALTDADEKASIADTIKVLWHKLKDQDDRDLVEASIEKVFGDGVKVPPARFTPAIDAALNAVEKDSSNPNIEKAAKAIATDYIKGKAVIDKAILAVIS